MSITNEELAEIKERLTGPGIEAYFGRRLIAALKAERAEVERLKKIINQYRSRVVSYRVDYK